VENKRGIRLNIRRKGPLRKRFFAVWSSGVSSREGMIFRDTKARRENVSIGRGRGGLLTGSQGVIWIITGETEENIPKGGSEGARIPHKRGYAKDWQGETRRAGRRQATGEEDRQTKERSCGWVWGRWSNNWGGRVEALIPTVAEIVTERGTHKGITTKEGGESEIHVFSFCSWLSRIGRDQQDSSRNNCDGSTKKWASPVLG